MCLQTLNGSGPYVLEGGVARLGARAGSDDHVSAGSSLEQRWAWTTRGPDSRVL